MNPKSLLAAVLSLASVTLLLAPAAQACVNFEACYYRDPNQNPTHCSIALFDNDVNNPICSMDGYPSSDGIYYLSCTQPGFSASWNPNSYVTTYTPAGRATVTFQNSTPNWVSGICSVSCQYGCQPGECFVS